MSKNENQTSHKRVNQITSTTSGVGVGMNANRESVSASRLYLLGKNMGKAAVIKSPTPRKIISGDEQEYAKTARKIKIDCDSVVEEIFFVKDPLNTTEPTYWGSYYVIFRSLEDGYYYLLEMPKFHSQNTDLGFEFHYKKDVMRKLVRGANFPGGTVFAESSRISDQNEWCPGIQANVALLSDHDCEEDAIKISDVFARKVGVCFEYTFDHQWNEDDWVLLNLYGDENNHQGFPLPGEPVREDGILFGFRRKDKRNALVGLTKKALMNPDELYDKLYWSKPGAIVADIKVETERYKNQANNKRAYKRTQPHTRHLELYESSYNSFYNAIYNWYLVKKREIPNGELLPIEKGLWNLILMAQGQITVDYINGSARRYTTIKRKFQNISLKDWRLIIKLKYESDAKVRFKMTGMHGNKATIGKIVPVNEMPIDDYGVRADIVAGNFPDFRRQIFSSLIEADVNFVNSRIYPDIKKNVLEGNYQKAWEIVTEFYKTVSPLQHTIVETFTVDEQIEHLDLIAGNENEFSFYPDPDVVGIDIIKNLEERYKDIKPTPVTFINKFGETIRTKNPVLISSMYYLMLDKFGDDISSQSTPKMNIFGIPTTLSKEERARNFYRAQGNRNVGATEGRLFINQSGGALAVQQLTLGNSPEAINMAVKRILRADNPFLIPRLVYPGEETKNYSLGLIRSILSDYGLVLRKECIEDRL